MPFPTSLDEKELKYAVDILTENQSKATVTSLAKAVCVKHINDFTLGDFCRVFKAVDYNKREFGGFYYSVNKSYKITSVRTFLTKNFKKVFSYFTQEALLQERAARVRVEDVVEKKARDTKVQIDRVKNIMSVFNLRPNELEQRLEELYNGNEAIDTVEYLKELHVLRLLFLEMAKGGLVTTKITATYEVDEDNDGSIKGKKIFTTRTGKKLVTVETQSHLPDTKALLGLNLLEDLILRVSTTADNVMVDEDEMQTRLVDYLAEAKLQRLEYSGVKNA